MATSIPPSQSSAVEPGMAAVAEPPGVVLLSEPPRTREPRAPPAAKRSGNARSKVHCDMLGI